jgi:hypothetical protein
MRTLILSLFIFSCSSFNSNIKWLEVPSGSTVDGTVAFSVNGNAIVNIDAKRYHEIVLPDGSVCMVWDLGLHEAATVRLLLFSLQSAASIDAIVEPGKYLPS